MHTLISNMPKTVYNGLIVATIIWLLTDIVITIKKKKHIGIPIGMFLLVISSILLILVKSDILSSVLSKRAPIGILTTCLLGASIAIYGGIRDFKREGKKTSPAMKKFFFGSGMIVAVGVITLIVAFIGMTLTKK